MQTWIRRLLTSQATTHIALNKRTREKRATNREGSVGVCKDEPTLGVMQVYHSFGDLLPVFEYALSVIHQKF